jgi:hypothetical protein
MSASRALAALALAVVLATCGDDEPKPGWLLVRLSAPAGASDAGAIFTVGGGPIDSVRSGLPTVHSARLSATSMRVLVGGDGLPGVIAEIWVPDVAGASVYAGTVEQVAERATLAQRDASAYRITIERM